MGKKRFLDNTTDYFGAGTYFLGVSAGVLINLLLNIPWQIKLFYFIVMFITGLILISKSKKLDKELRKKKAMGKKVKKK